MFTSKQIMTYTLGALAVFSLRGCAVMTPDAPTTEAAELEVELKQRCVEELMPCEGRRFGGRGAIRFACSK